MPSEFETIVAEFSSPFAVELFGERNSLGDMETLLYVEETGEPRELVGVIVHLLRVSDEIQDEHGTHLRDQIEDVVEIQVPRGQSFGKFKAKTGAEVSIPRHEGEAFTVLEVLSETEAWTHLRLSRRHVTDIRRGGAQRS